MAVWLVILALSVGAGAPSHAPAEGERQVKLQQDALNPGAKCGTCHVQIYNMWRRSMHSNAFTDPIFQASYMQAYMETSGEASKICLRCHAPAAFLAGELDSRGALVREGVTCDFCHSLSAVDVDNPSGSFYVTLDGVKRGPLGNTQSPAHQVARSSLHESSELCASCHQYTNPAGVPILTTFDEWKLSPQGKSGKQCQHCHMPVTPGKTVRSGLGVERDGINLHDISGMHSNEQVRSAVVGRLRSIRRTEPDMAEVVVEIENVGSGHSVPTGLPTRKLVLDVTVFCNGKVVKQIQRVYQRILLDEQGIPIREDHRAMLEARRLLSDTRIQPGERREELLTLEVPKHGTLDASVKLQYSYQPMLLGRENITIDLATESLP